MQPQLEDSQPAKDFGPEARVTAFMAPWVPVARPEHRMSEVVPRMASHKLEAMPVVDADHRLVGLLTRRSIAVLLGAGDKTLEEIQVKDAMSRDTSRLPANATAADALKLMVGRQSQWLPVVDHDSRVVGMLGMSDIIARAAILGAGGTRRGAWLEVVRRGRA